MRLFDCALLVENWFSIYDTKHDYDSVYYFRYLFWFYVYADFCKYSDICAIVFLMLTFVLLLLILNAECCVYLPSYVILRYFSVFGPFQCLKKNK